MDKQNLTTSEYLYVCTLIKECSARLISESLNDFKYGGKYASNYATRLEPEGDGNTKDDEKPEILDDLMKIYEKSGYFLSSEATYYLEYISEQVWIVFRDRIFSGSRNYKRTEILTPVLFYSLILQNESSPVTVKHRMNQVYNCINQKKISSPLGVINPFREWRKSYFKDESVEKFTKKLKKHQGTFHSSAFQTSNYVSRELRSAALKLDSLQGKLHYVRCISEMARAGTFLGQILTTTKGSDLDTLLRLYFVDYFQDILKVCRLLIDDSCTFVTDNSIHYKEYERMDIATEYVKGTIRYDILEHYSPHQKYAFPVTFQNGHDSLSIKYFQQGQSMGKTRSFKELYSFLKDTFNFNFPDIISFYLDENKLKPLIDAEKAVQKHLQIQTKLASYLEKIEQQNENLNCVLTVLQMLDSRMDVLTNQSCITETETELQAKKEYEDRIRDIILQERTDIAHKEAAEVLGASFFSVDPKDIEDYVYFCCDFDDEDEGDFE